MRPSRETSPPDLRRATDSDFDTYDPGYGKGQNREKGNVHERGHGKGHGKGQGSGESEPRTKVTRRSKGAVLERPKVNRGSKTSWWKKVF